MVLKRHPAKIFSSAFIVAGALLALLFLGSCNSETPTMCPTTGVGVLEGYLRVTGQGLTARIEARDLEGPNPRNIVAATTTDSTGWYRLELPTGLYQLVVSPNSSSSSTSELYDTIRVLPRVFRFDLKRGRAEIRISMPDDQEGGRFSLRLRNPDLGSMNESARVEEGVLVFEFPALVPAVYTMDFDGGDLVDNYYLPGFDDSSDADNLEVDLDNAAVYEADFRDSYASISGSITGSWEISGPGLMPDMEVVSPDSQLVGRGQHNYDGTFTCGFLLPRTVLLRSEYRRVIQWIGGETFETARVFDLQPGDRITGVTVVESGIKVYLDGPGNLTLHRPVVTIRAASGEEFHPDSNFDNPFVISNLRSGRYYLYVEGYCENAIWASQWYGGAESFDGAVAIDLAEGELRQITMELVRGGRIEGNLLRSDGTRPRYVNYGLFDPAGEPECPGSYQWRSFDQGIFSFQGLGDGDYFLAVQTGGDEIWWYPGTRLFSEATPLAIENHTDLTEINWVLP